MSARPVGGMLASLQTTRRPAMDAPVAPLQHRVLFDFEIDFSNGGGLQGQGFRLDIEGEDIADEDLAQLIVRDLRLLMVGSVRILRRQVIVEAHKRVSGEAA